MEHRNFLLGINACLKVDPHNKDFEQEETNFQDKKVTENDFQSIETITDSIEIKEEFSEDCVEYETETSSVVISVETQALIGCRAFTEILPLAELAKEDSASQQVPQEQQHFIFLEQTENVHQVKTETGETIAIFCSPINELQENPLNDPLSLEGRPDQLTEDVKPQTYVLPSSWDLTKTCRVLLDRNEVAQYMKPSSHQKSITQKNNLLLRNFRLKKTVVAITQNSCRKRHLNTTHRCKICSKTFCTPINLKKHLVIHSSARPFKCHDCGNDYKSKAYLKVHIILKHIGDKGKRFRCHICDKRYTNQYLVNNHVNSFHFNIKQYKCENCNKNFCYKQSLIAHLKFCSNIINKPKCKTCGKTFGEKYSLAKHIARVHLGERNHACTQCDLRFFLLSDLNTYVIVHHNKKKPFPCNICSKSFVRKVHLKDHLRRSHNICDSNEKQRNYNISESDKKVACEQCGKVYHKSSLQRHINEIHKREKKHKCTQCDKSYFQLHLLKHHVAAVHKNERQFKCSKCSKSYLYRKDIYHHMKKKHNMKVKRHKCISCNKKFHQLKNLNTHKSNTHNTFICELCDKRIAGKKLLYQHMKNEYIFSIVKSEPHIKTEDGQDILTTDNSTIENDQTPVNNVFEDKIEIKEEMLEKYIEENDTETEEEPQCKGSTDSSTSRLQTTDLKQELPPAFLQPDLQATPEMQQQISLVNQEERLDELTNNVKPQTSVLPVSWDLSKTCSVLLDRNEVEQYLKHTSHQKPFANKIDLLQKNFRLQETTDAKPQNSTGKQYFISTTHPCEISDQVFLQKHLESLKSKCAARPLKCHNCGKCYKSKFTLKTHIRQKHSNKKKLKCQICNKMYINKYSLKLHINGHHLNIKKYKCEYCNTLFIRKQDLIQHNLKFCVNKRNDYTLSKSECKTCGNTFGEKYSLAKHIARVHLGERNHACTQCDLRFFMLRDLNRHVVNKHSKNKCFPCNICNKSYGRKDHLKGHLRRSHNISESNKKQVACEQCGKFFYHNGSLQRHISDVHKREKKHMCTQCDKGFLYLYLLKDHVTAVHKKERQFKCSKCSKSYLYRRDINEHMKKKHNMKFNSCDKKFNQLTTHKSNIHNTFICELCDKKIAGKKLLYQHMKNEHIFSNVKSKPRHIKTEDGQDILTTDNSIIENDQTLVNNVFEDQIEIKEETLEKYIEENDTETEEESQCKGSTDSSASRFQTTDFKQELPPAFLQPDLQATPEMQQQLAVIRQIKPEHVEEGSSIVLSSPPHSSFLKSEVPDLMTQDSQLQTFLLPSLESSRT